MVLTLAASPMTMSVAGVKVTKEGYSLPDLKSSKDLRR